MNAAELRSPLPVLRIVHAVLLVVWAGFWAWFVVAVSLGEKPAPPWWIPAAWIVGLGACVAGCLFRPILGGVLLSAVGLFAAFFFRNIWAELALAAPALLLGATAIALGRKLAAAGVIPAAR